MPEQKCIKRDASGKKSMLSCCISSFEQNAANLAYNQAENLPNVQKMHLWQKAQGVNRLVQEFL